MPMQENEKECVREFRKRRGKEPIEEGEFVMSRVRGAIIVLITGCVIMFAGGCSKKTPNESNFRQAINHNLSKNPM